MEEEDRPPVLRGPVARWVWRSRWPCARCGHRKVVGGTRDKGMFLPPMSLARRW